MPIILIYALIYIALVYVIGIVVTSIFLSFVPEIHRALISRSEQEMERNARIIRGLCRTSLSWPLIAIVLIVRTTFIQIASFPKYVAVVSCMIQNVFLRIRKKHDRVQ